MQRCVEFWVLGPKAWNLSSFTSNGLYNCKRLRAPPGSRAGPEQYVGGDDGTRALGETEGGGGGVARQDPP